MSTPNKPDTFPYYIGALIMQKITDHPDYAILRFEIECNGPMHSYAYILCDVLRKMVEDHNDPLTLNSLAIYMKDEIGTYIKDEIETLLSDANDMFHEIYDTLVTKIEHLQKMEKP